MSLCKRSGALRPQREKRGGLKRLAWLVGVVASSEALDKLDDAEEEAELSASASSAEDGKRI